ncbi:MAG: ABC transporter ATP-binding protein [Candidatus Brocadiia bacterium]
MIQVEDLSINLGEFHLRDTSLAIQEGEYMVLLGPTGAGKTVLVECLVGIYRPKTGRVLIDGRDVTALYPEERNVGYVPQDYALFPNMTVESNVAYGLKARKRAAHEVEEKVQAMLDLLGIAHLDYRLPLNLSGGEKQRVALGRALITQPRVLLLDEPLAALDENLRSELAAELRRIHGAVRGTFLHVCHSFEETAEVADRIAIMNEGRLVQVGRLDEVLARPASPFVARFTRTRNLLEGTAERAGDGCRVALDGGPSLASAYAALEGPVVAAVRPEDIQLLAPDAAGAREALSGEVTHVRRMPTYTELEIDAGVPLVAHDRLDGGRRARHAVGDRVALRIRPEAVKVFPREQGA